MIPELKAKIDDILKNVGKKKKKDYTVGEWDEYRWEACAEAKKCLIRYEKKKKRYFTGAEWDKYIRYITRCLKI